MEFTVLSSQHLTVGVDPLFLEHLLKTTYNYKYYFRFSEMYRYLLHLWSIFLKDLKVIPLKYNHQEG